MRFLQCRSQILYIETDNSLRCPCTSRIRRIAPRFILKHHHLYGNIQLFIRGNKLAKEIRVCRQVTRVLNKEVRFSQFCREYPFCLRSFISLQIIVLRRMHRIIFITAHRIILIDFHPAGRTPWRNPEGHVRIITLGRLDIRHKRSLIAVYIKMLQFKISRHLIAAVPVA